MVVVFCCYSYNLHRDLRDWVLLFYNVRDGEGTGCCKYCSFSLGTSTCIVQLSYTTAFHTVKLNNNDDGGRDDDDDNIFSRS